MQGGCSECFSNVANSTLAPDVTEFFQLHKTLKDCWEAYLDDKQFNSSDYGKSQCCHACKGPYNNLINLYHEIKERKAKNAPSDFGQWPKMLTGCSDLDDIYNYTGFTMWRGEFRCYPPIQNDLTILALTVAFIVLCVLIEFHPGCFPHCGCFMCWYFEQVCMTCKYSTFPHPITHYFNNKSKATTLF